MPATHPDTKTRIWHLQEHAKIAQLWRDLEIARALCEHSSSPDNDRLLMTGAANNPGAAASPHTGYSAGVNPNAGTPSGTNDGTDDTGATSPGSRHGSRQATQTGSATQK